MIRAYCVPAGTVIIGPKHKWAVVDEKNVVFNDNDLYLTEDAYERLKVQIDKFARASEDIVRSYSNASSDYHNAD